MSFKFVFKITLLVLIITLSIPVQSNALDRINLSDSATDARILSTISNRVAEIQSMDKSNISSEERKALKKELKQMKQQAVHLGPGVYLSVGAIIIIILLLILLL
jgi:hypothetical protein